MDSRKQITYRLVTAVLESRKSHRQIAEEAGVSLNTMHYYMNKGGMPGADKLAALCRALEVSADWLLGLESKYMEPSNDLLTLEELREMEGEPY